MLVAPTRIKKKARMTSCCPVQMLPVQIIIKWKARMSPRWPIQVLVVRTRAKKKMIFRCPIFLVSQICHKLAWPKAINIIDFIHLFWKICLCCLFPGNDQQLHQLQQGHVEKTKKKRCRGGRSVESRVKIKDNRRLYCIIQQKAYHKSQISQV